MVYLFEKYDKSELTFADFWRQHNEHRLVFPKLIFLGLGILSRYDVRWEMMTSIGLSILLYLIVLRHINKNRAELQIKDNERILWIIFSTILFSLSQWENWLWGFQIQWFLNLLAVAAGGFIIANRKINLYTIFMLTCCGIVATFSLSSGMLLWPIVLLLLGIYQVKNPKKPCLYLIAAWIVFSGIIISLYLYGYKKPRGHPDLFFFLERPDEFISYICRYLGSSFNFFSDSTLKSFLFGPLGILIFSLFSAIYVYRKKGRELQSCFFFILIGLYGILGAVLTAIGRSGFGVDQAESSRYISVANFLWISVIYFLFSAKTVLKSGSKLTKHVFKYAKVVILVVLFISLNIKSFKSISMFRETHASRTYGQYAVQYGAGLDGLKNLFPDPYRLLRHDIPLLKRLRFSVFKNSIPPITFKYAPANWLLKDGWSFDGIYNFSSLHTKSDSQYVLGSWSGADSNTGSIQSIPVRLNNSVLASIPVIHGPDVSHQKIGLKIGAEEPVELLCDLNSRAHLWHLCQFDLSPYTGKEFTIFAEDLGAGWGQWIGFAQPVLIESE